MSQYLDRGILSRPHHRAEPLFVARVPWARVWALPGQFLIAANAATTLIQRLATAHGSSALERSDGAEFYRRHALFSLRFKEGVYEANRKSMTKLSRQAI